MIKFRMRSHFYQLLPPVSLIAIFCGSSKPSVAQIVPDNTLGVERSVVTPNINIRNIPSERIDGGAVRGSNLFHSFQEFNVEAGRGVYFSNPESIVNILTRVTGDNLSNILGTLGVLGNANLFLINPNGIVFGPNARLDVGGSFFASTADGILFENGVEFAASNPEAPPLLSINIPLGLNIRENPGTIVNQAILTTSEDGSLIRDDAGFLIPQGLNVPRNQTLALVGGDIIFDNAIAISPGSNIELGGLSEPGIIQLSSDGRLTFPTDVQRGNITLANESQINLRSDGGGNVKINARNFEISGGSIVRAGIDQGLGSAEAVGGDVNINAQENILITGAESSIRNVIDTDGTGQTGNTNINANTITLQDGGVINSILLGQGTGGTININANTVTLREGEIISNLLGQGNAGNINLITESLTMEQESSINSSIVGQGNGGLISIQANTIELSDPGTVIFGGSFSEGVGQAGELKITTGSLTLKDGVVIDTSTWGRGDGGDITIDASDSVILTNNSDIASGVGNRNNPNAVGNGGDITITARSLTLRSGSQIGSIAFTQGNTGKIVINTTDFIEVEGTSLRRGTDGSERISKSSIGNSAGLLFKSSGDARDIEITSGNLILRGGGEISSFTLGSGNAGSIQIQVSQIQLIDVLSETVIDGESFSIPKRSRISSTTVGGTGNAGDITITAERLSLQNGSQISTASMGRGNSGNLTIQAAEIEIIGTTPGGELPSQLNSSTFDFTQELEDLELPIEPGTGNAGDITIEAERIVIRDGGQIRSDNLDSAGNAGNITVQATDIELIGASVPLEEGISLWSSGFSSVSGVGNAGNITIETERLAVRDGGGIYAATLGTGNAGSVEIQARNIEVTGTARDGELPSRLSAEVTESAIGEGGTVNVNAQELTVREGANLTVSSRGQGNPGNLQVNVNNIRLDTQGSLTAESATGQGGNIGIRSTDLRLRRQSEISATGSETGVTQEGNITIETNLLVLLEGSRILTSAFDPAGGSNIAIRPFSGSELAVIQSNNSIINAAGDLSIDTTLNFDPPDVSEVTVVDPAALIAQDPCKQRGDSEFIITGRGGIASSPNNIFTGDRTQVNLVEPVRSSQNRSISTQSARTEPNQPRSSADIVPARGWIRDENGDVILVSYDPTKTGVRRQLQNSHYCDR